MLTILAFSTIATIISVSYGFLVKNGKLPFNSVMAFNDSQWQFMRTWVKIALFLGVILPLFMWLVFWHQAALYHFFSLYLLLVAIQLVSEIFFSRLLCKSVVVIIGTLYTGFRIWQLWEGWSLINDTQLWLTLYLLVLLFWIANMIMLFTLAIPSIFPRFEKP